MAYLSEHKLKELIKVTRGASLSGQYFEEEGDLIRLTLGNFDYANGGFKLNTSKDNLYYSGPVANNFIMNEGDIITPMTEQTPGLLGSTARIPESGKYIQSQDVGLVICDEEMIDKDFCYYLLPSEIVKKQLAAGAQQTKIRHTSPDKIEACTVFIPKPNEQRKIGKLLSTIDKLIDLKRKENAILESMAKQIYDYWFVQFDFPNENGKPYKSSGGKMVWNEKLKREIPEYWHCGNLFEIAKFTNGIACQRYRPRVGEIPLPVIKIREMHEGFKADSELVSPNIPEAVKVYNGDILFSWSASLEVMLWANGMGGLNQHIFKVTSANEFPKTFYFYQLLDYVAVFRKIAESRRTTMGHITQDHLEQSTIAIPNDNAITKKYDKCVLPIFDQQISLQEEITELQNLRDYLLPLLMTGQVTIKD